MSNEEFNSYIKEKVKPGKVYSSEEMYEICLAHHSLPRKDRNWDDLAAMLEFGKSGTALRKWMEYQRRKGAKTSVEENNRELTDYEKEYIERTKTRDTWNSYRRTLRDEARIESFKDGIIKAVSELKPLPAVKVATNSAEKEHSMVEAVLMISDLHLGVQCNNSVNKYDNDVAWKRLCKLATDTVDYCITHNVYKLNILNLGDMVAGLIHDTIRLDQEADVVSQIMLASEYLAAIINSLRAAAPVVTYRSCTDNHSRAMPDKNQHIERENFNRIIDWFIQERLKDTKVRFIDDNLDIGLGRFKLLNNKVIMYSHGHEDRINTALQSFVGATHEWVDYILMAHFHSSKEKTFQGAKVFVNGSIVGTDPYAYSKRLFGKPEQKLLIFDKDNLLDINIQLDIDA